MVNAQMYFLSDQFFLDFDDPFLMKNKTVGGSTHNRPYFLAFPDVDEPRIYWVVPISSNVEKYTIQAQKIEAKYKVKNSNYTCETIRFGKVLGRDAAFLIQNMCPTIDMYMTPYLDKNGCPILPRNDVSTDVIRHATAVLAKVKRGVKMVFPDVLGMYNELKKKLQ
ncbi:MAG: hypothetical protein LUD47_01190 [Clostridia bacterium]|nr:hypothetical protein [Clostridia bacterium]